MEKINPLYIKENETGMIVTFKTSDELIEVINHLREGLRKLSEKKEPPNSA